MNAFFLMPVIWLCFIIISVLLEAVSEKLIAIWFAPAAGLALVCGVIGMSALSQIAFFVGVGVMLVLLAQAVCVLVKRQKKHNDGDDGIE